ncbi:MAG TPA: low affinity iron permease family protein [Gemmatimonadaceae bacterium]
MNGFFRTLAQRTSAATGSPWTFLAAVLIVLGWALTGPMFHYSDTWQLVINTGTTIVTFLMVFLIQNTQNRDAKAMHLKLDELLRAVTGARTRLVDLEDLSDDELARLQHEFQSLRERLQRASEEVTASRDAHASHPKRRAEDRVEP